MNALWIIVVAAVLLVCVGGLVFDRDRRSGARGVHRATRADHRVDQLEQRVDQHGERIDVIQLIAETAHERIDVLDVPMLSPPPDGYPEQATAVMPITRRRSRWPGVAAHAAGILLTVAGVAGAVLVMFQTDPTANRDNQPAPKPPPPSSHQAPEPPPLEPPARPVTTTTVTKTETVTVEAVVGSPVPRDGSAPPASSAAAPPPSEPAAPPPTTPPPGEPLETEPCVPPLVPPACVVNPQLGGG